MFKIEFPHPESKIQTGLNIPSGLLGRNEDGARPGSMTVLLHYVDVKRIDSRGQVEPLKRKRNVPRIRRLRQTRHLNRLSHTPIVPYFRFETNGIQWDIEGTLRRTQPECASVGSIH